MSDSSSSSDLTDEELEKEKQAAADKIAARRSKDPKSKIEICVTVSEIGADPRAFVDHLIACVKSSFTPGELETEPATFTASGGPPSPKVHGIEVP